MSVSKVSVDNIPKDVLGDLQALVSSAKTEYIAVGTGFYALEPMPAIKLMEVLGKFMETLEGLRRGVIEEILSTLTPENQEAFDSSKVFVTVRDILRDNDAMIVLKDLMEEVLEGIDPEDFNIITPTQLSKVIDAIIKVNIDTLPQSFREAILPGSTSVVEDTEKTKEAPDKTKNP